MIIQTETRNLKIETSPNLFSLPNGFTSRNAVMSDVPAAVRLLNAYDKHYLGYEGYTDNIFETDWKTPKFNPETDIHLVFNQENDLIGYTAVWAISTPPVHPWVTVRVHPDYHYYSIGNYLMEWAEHRAMQSMNQCPEEFRVAYRSGTVSTIDLPKSLYSSFGLNLIRHSFRMVIEMEKTPPDPFWPEGITVRAVTDPTIDIETICRVDIESFKDHFGFIEQPFEDELSWFTNWLTNDESLNDSSLWFLAMDGDQAIGLALCAVWDLEDRAFGYINSLGVLRPYRNKGIGLALLHHAFGEYYRRGKRGVSLGVDAENLTGALNLYKKAGMHVHRQFDLYEKELRPGKEISVESLAD